LTAVFGGTTSAFIDYQLEVGGSGTGHAVMGGARFRF
jgi:hypothetical protein